MKPHEHIGTYISLSFDPFLINVSQRYHMLCRDGGMPLMLFPCAVAGEGVNNGDTVQSLLHGWQVIQHEGTISMA